MKNILLLFMLLTPLLGSAQAHLGSSEDEIREMHIENDFETGYTESGVKYISSFMIYGTFYYYFDAYTELSDFCMQIVDEMPNLNRQVEEYNKKYVIVSDTEWKAYLAGGSVLNITLSYNEENEVYVFYYAD